MPVYNGERYIEYAIKSIINQSYKNIQLILVDGGSTDGTMDIVNKYADAFEIIISEKDKGMYDAINKGFSHADGELMLWLNSDDYLFENAIKSAVMIMKKYPKVKWIKGRNAYLDQNNILRKIACFQSYYQSLIKSGYYRSDVIGSIMQETTFWHRDLYIKAGNHINIDYKVASDYELWVRFAKFETLYSINTLLGAFRQHNAQLSADINLYETECNSIKNITPLKRFLIKPFRYFFYFYAMFDRKNKIAINQDGESFFLKKFAYFQ
jgi:glycosyltransferase involved in cell wall biosynthesis